jgi:CheY-like chemotaxis protein
VLNNATKFTDPGGTITITATVASDVSPQLLSISIADSGAGITPSTLPHVFELFVQGETPGRGKQGLGIGLGLAKQLVEMHGGAIEAHSDGAGRGSVFTIRIPSLTWESAPATGQDEDPEARPCVGLRVLVIDDNVDAADTLAALVVELGGEAMTAYGGRDGLRCTVEFRPDVVLLDIGMPEVDGYETCRMLRAEPVGRAAYVVAVTGFGQLHDRDRALADGFDAHLTKPADPRVLANVLGEAPIRRSEAG